MIPVHDDAGEVVRFLNPRYVVDICRMNRTVYYLMANRENEANKAEVRSHYRTPDACREAMSEAIAQVDASNEHPPAGCYPNANGQWDPRDD